MKAKNILEIEQVDVTSKKHTILADINLKIPKNSIQVIIGPSGSGKTTLLKVMNGLIKPSKGKVKFEGKELNYNKISEIRKKIGYVPQNLGLIKSKTVLENILMGSLARVSTFQSLFGHYPTEEIQLAEHLLKVVGLKEHRNKKIYYLSGGEKRRVAIARAFMQKPEVLIADEILSDLDFYKVEQITKEITKLKKEFKITVIMVEHDMTIAKAFGEQITILRRGKIMCNHPRGKLTDKIIFQCFTK